MKSKRGEATSITQDILIGVIAAALFAVVLFYGTNAFASIVKKDKIECENSKWWDAPRALNDVLKSVDKGNYEEFQFNNNDCNLVSFSFIQGIPEIQYPGGGLSRQPKLCLCNIEDDICKPYDCYAFSNYEQINTEQFSTEDLEPVVFLKFIKDGKILRLEAYGKQKPIEVLTYELPNTPTLRDQTKLINRLAIRPVVRDIDGFLPIAEVKETGFLIPQGVDNIENFTSFFDLTIALPPLEGQTEQDYLTHHTPISPNIINQAAIELSIEKTKFDSLTEQRKHRVVLYYKIDQTWKYSPMTCAEQDTVILCLANLNEFSSNFAISVKNE